MFKNARKVMPGGVNSPVRSFNAVNSTPVYIKKAKGAYLYDEDNNKYIDYINSFGPLIFGHSKKEISQAAIRAIKNGTTFGACHANEIELAELIKEKIPSMQMVRLTSSGTEATMSAIRLARGFTRKDKIIKFEGCYHGHVDHLLVKAGSGLSTFGSPSSPGVPKDFTKNTLIAEFNNIEQVEKLFRKNKNSIAAIVIEPVPANMGLVLPKNRFLKQVLDLAHSNKSLVIFDEVISGFRLSIGGAQGFYNLKPDITCIGKIIGGGFPIGAFGGRKDIMSMVSPTGPVYQAGTLSGNPVAVSAGMKTLELIQKPNFFKNLSKTTKSLVDGLIVAARTNNVEFSAQSVGGMFGFYFSAQPPESFEEVMVSDRDKFNKFFHLMLDQGIYFGPSAFEAGFVSSAHSMDDINQTIQAADVSFKKLK